MMMVEKAKALMTLDGLISVETTQMGSSPEIIADLMISIHTRHTQTHTHIHTHTHKHTHALVQTALSPTYTRLLRAPLQTNRPTSS